MGGGWLISFLEEMYYKCQYLHKKNFQVYLRITNFQHRCGFTDENYSK